MLDDPQVETHVVELQEYNQPIWPTIACLGVVFIIAAITMIIFVVTRMNRIKDYLEVPYRMEHFDLRIKERVNKWNNSDDNWKSDLYIKHNRSIIKGKIDIIINETWWDISDEQKSEFTEECFTIWNDIHSYQFTGVHVYDRQGIRVAAKESPGATVTLNESRVLTPPSIEANHDNEN